MLPERNNVYKGIPSPIRKWMAYDFASSALLLSSYLYGQEWLLGQSGMRPIYFSLLVTFALVVAGMLSPALGRRLWDSREAYKWLFILVAGTACAYAACGGIAITGRVGEYGAIPGLVCFGMMLIGYQLTMVPYNYSLRYLQTIRRLHFTSGLGIAAGYAGQLCLGSILLVVTRLLHPQESLERLTFFPTVIFYLVFSAPLIGLLRSLRGQELLPSELDTQFEGGLDRKAANSFKPELLKPILFDTFLIVSGVAAVGLFAPHYVEYTYGIHGVMKTGFFLLAVLSALVGGVVYGRITAPWDSLRLLRALTGSWFLVVILAYSVRVAWVAWLVAIAFGFLLSVTWSLCRVLVFESCPEPQLGRAYGYYNLATVAGVIAGSNFWSIVYEFKHNVSGAEMGTTFAVSAIAFAAAFCVACFVLRD